MATFPTHQLNGTGGKIASNALSRASTRQHTLPDDKAERSTKPPREYKRGPQRYRMAPQIVLQAVAELHPKLNRPVRLPDVTKALPQLRSQTIITSLRLLTERHQLLRSGPRRQYEYTLAPGVTVPDDLTEWQAVPGTITLNDHPPVTARSAAVRTVGAVVIEQGIPIPKRKGHGGSGLSEAIRTMQVGESFVHHRSCNNLGKLALPGTKFTQRQIGDKQWRIWRIA